MGILDRYIIKKFLGTFFFSIALIISIAVVFDITEKLDDFIEKEAPLRAIIFDYYLNFIPYFANLFSFLFVFISVIFFTSKMASNTEIIAILSSGVSFKRFLLPYFISATVLASMSFYLNNFLIPDANKVRLTFEEQYIRNPFTNTEQNIHIQLDDSSYAYFESYNSFSDIGYKLDYYDATSLEDTVDISSTGTGGLSNYYFGASVKLHKTFSAGVNAKYIFGC